ncbi:ABC transporter permease subunit [Mesorhizobium sp. B2-4-6]|uniref:ABC transporter permease subunit n=1 Tax=Mesorhizobium sp. B2-4-6 TaxID=2589943 RepID=UPI001FEE24E6|nr:ABC transporter permease subunit [Mesorhizobium sp. B2-4-6]
MYETVSPFLGFWSVGALVTLGLAAAVFPIALAVGLAVAFANVSEHRLVTWLARSYLAVFRGLPELLVIFAFYFGSSILLQHLNSVTGVYLPSPSPFLAAALALAVQFGAYAGIVFADWLRVFPTGLIEAGYAVGMTKARIRRRIILPILLRQATPSLGNLFLVLLKISALASVIGVEELSRRTSVIAGSTREPLLCYAVAAVLYLCISATAGLIQAWIESRARGAVGA